MLFLYPWKVPSDIEDAAYAYMFVVLLGTGATVFYNMISNMLRALGDSKTPLYFLVFSSVLNIILDELFILPLHMGVAGAAWANDPVTVSFCPALSGCRAAQLSDPASAQRRFS